MSDLDLAALKALARAATPRPWVYDEGEMQMLPHPSTRFDPNGREGWCGEDICNTALAAGGWGVSETKQIEYCLDAAEFSDLGREHARFAWQELKTLIDKAALADTMARIIESDMDENDKRGWLARYRAITKEAKR